MGRERVDRRTTGVGTFVAAYNRLWSGRYGSASVLSLGARQRTRVAEVAGALGEEEVEARLGRYFLDGDGWLVERGHPVDYFLKNVNRYAGGRHGEAKGRARILRHGDLDG